MIPVRLPSLRARGGHSARWWPALGVLSASVIAVCVNVLVSRFYARWDLTSRRLYTLSAPTEETLQTLTEPVEIIVFLSRGDPLLVTVRHLLAAYRAESPLVKVRLVDPDRNPAEFLTLQRRYGIVAGQAEDGRAVTDAAIVVAQGERHWFVTADELVTFDPEDGTTQPRIEEKLTEGLRAVRSRERATVCFSAGHQELRTDDGGPTGLMELTFRLGKNNYDIQDVELEAPRLALKLDRCRVLVIAGPNLPFGPRAVERALRYFRGGGNVLVLANTVLDDELRPVRSGLEELTAAGGIRLLPDTIIERDPARKLPQGVGEQFLVVSHPHPVTAGLGPGTKPMFQVSVTVAQRVEAMPGSTATPLLTTSGDAFSVADVRPFLKGEALLPRRRDARGPFRVAMAAELLQPRARSAHGPRMVVVGTASLAWARSWREPELTGNRLFVESAISWLAAEPTLLSIPERPRAPVGVSLTQESLASVWRYVVFYLPLTTLLLGAYVMYRRRAQERRSRRNREGAR